MGVGVSSRERSSDSGFSLIEVLIVVAILGLIAVILTVAVSKALKRQRLETAARQLQSFIDNGYVNTTQQGQAVFLQIGPAAADGSRTATLTADTNGNGALDASPTDTVLATQLIPGDIVLVTATTTFPSVSGTYILECDTMGRAINPTLTTPAQITAPATVSLTHKEMGSGGNLRPNLRYDIQVSPLWSPIISKVRY
jgi:prepilin-type N-terminal cleavage/methylation domain-containing protein